MFSNIGSIPCIIGVPNQTRVSAIQFLLQHSPKMAPITSVGFSENYIRKVTGASLKFVHILAAVFSWKKSVLVFGLCTSTSIQIYGRERQLRLACHIPFYIGIHVPLPSSICQYFHFYEIFQALALDMGNFTYWLHNVLSSHLRLCFPITVYSHKMNKRKKQEKATHGGTYNATLLRL